MKNKQFSVGLGQCSALAGVLALSSAAHAVTYTVNNTNDTGSGSLRQAILNANANPNAVGGSLIQFHIAGTVPAGGAWTIKPATGLPAIIGTNVTVDGTTQTAYHGDTNPKGPEIVIQGPGSTLSGFIVTGNNNLIKGMAIGKFAIGVCFAGTKAHEDRVQNCYVGLNASGTSAMPNTKGVVLTGGAYDDTVGSGLPDGGNVISGNTVSGVEITGQATKNNLVSISLIGLSADGTKAIPNQYGVKIMGGAQSNSVGESVIGQENHIAGNQYNVDIQGDNTNQNRVINNFIGIAPNGTGFSGQSVGLQIEGGAEFTTVGGQDGTGVNLSRWRNFIGYCGTGVKVTGLYTDSNRFENNFIGVGLDGKTAAPNGIGLDIDNGASHNTLSTTNNDPNVIVGSTKAGLVISGQSGPNPTYENEIYGCYIGVAKDGVTAVPNAVGVLIGGGAQNNLVGGDLASPDKLFQSNLISGNSGPGVAIQGVTTTQNSIFGNFIGLDAKGQPLANNGPGVLLTNGAFGNQIGLEVDNAGTDDTDCYPHACFTNTGPGKGNKIQYNHGDGVLVTDTSVDNAIRANIISNNDGPGINLQPQGEAAHQITPNDFEDLDAGPNDVTNAPVLTSLTQSGFDTVVNGSLSAYPNHKYSIDIFASGRPNQDGHGDGEEYVCSIYNISTGSTGHATFSRDLPGTFQGLFISATATDDEGNTSEFSNSLRSAPITISVDSVSTPEDNGLFQGNLTFHVTLSRQCSRIVTVHCATQDGVPAGSNATAATANVDYQPLSQDLVFPPGTTSLTVTVHTIPDTLKESDETFLLNLSALQNAQWGQKQGVGTIVDNDQSAPVIVSLSPANVTTAVNTSQNLTTNFSDADGATDIAGANIQIGTPASAGSTANLLLGYYDQTANLLYLRNDAGTGYIGGYAPGSAHIINNAQGSLNCAATHITVTGNNLKIVWSFKVAASQAGLTLPIALYVVDKANASDGYDTLGSWAVPASAAARFDDGSSGQEF